MIWRKRINNDLRQWPEITFNPSIVFQVYACHLDSLHLRSTALLMTSIDLKVLQKEKIESKHKRNGQSKRNARTKSLNPLETPNIHLVFIFIFIFKSLFAMRFGLYFNGFLTDIEQFVILYWRMDGQGSRCKVLILREKQF